MHAHTRQRGRLPLRPGGCPAGLGMGSVLHLPKPHWDVQTVESLFVLHSVTGNVMYQHWAWDIAMAIERNCRADK